MKTNSNAALFANYDLLAVLPLDNYAFSHACQSLITPSPISIDIITLDLHSSPRLPFLLKRSHVLSAINAGVAFEVIYAPTISSSTAYPKDARRNVFAGVRELIRVTNGGRGILLSSSVKTIMELRAPDDLTSLLETLGAKAEHAKDALSSLPRNVVARGFSNRQTFKATIKGPTVETFAQTFSVTQKAVDGPADQSKKRARENTAPSTEPSQQPSGTATKPSKANKKQKSSR